MCFVWSGMCRPTVIAVGNTGLFCITMTSHHFSIISYHFLWYIITHITLSFDHIILYHISYHVLIITFILHITLCFDHIFCISYHISYYIMFLFFIIPYHITFRSYHFLSYHIIYHITLCVDHIIFHSILSYIISHYVYHIIFLFSMHTHLSMEYDSRQITGTSLKISYKNI